MKTLALILLVICAPAAFAVNAGTTEETRLTEVLESTPSSQAEKEDACRRLKQIGTARAVPALARLLAGEPLSQAARDALEGMRCKEAGASLRASLKMTSGNTKIGIVHSLGERRDQRAVRELIPLLGDPDPLLASAAAQALGRIGGSQAARPLLKAAAKASDPVRSDIVDGLLQCATSLVAEGASAQAIALFRSLSAPAEREWVRVAAHAGLIRTAGEGALRLITADLESGDPARESAALPLACQLRDPRATTTFTNLLRPSPPAMQVALLGMLQQRGDVTAAPAVMRAADHPQAAVRLAALAALGSLGDETAVPLLVAAAAATEQTEQTEQKVARQALVELHHGEVAETLILELSCGSPAVRLALIRALADRCEKSAIPRLLELARSQEEPTRKAALGAIRQLADGSHLASVVKLIEETHDETALADVLAVLASIAARAEEGKALDVSPIVQGLATAKADTRIALLQASALFADERLRAALRAGLKDPDVQLRLAAARALCSSRDMELMPDMLELARHAEEANIHTLALEGCVRLTAEQGSAVSAQERIQLLKLVLEIATGPQDKRRVLSGLGEIADLAALKVVSTLLEDTEVQKEAAQASVKIAEALGPAHAQEALGVLNNALSSNDTATHKALETAFKRVSELVPKPPH